MNKSKKIKLLISSFSVLATTGVIATTLTSCGTSGGKNSDTSIAQVVINDSTKQFFTAATIDPVVINALTTKLSTSINTNLVVNNVSANDIFYNVKNNCSKANMSGKIDINGVYHTYTLTVMYDITNDLYTTTIPVVYTSGNATGDWIPVAEGGFTPTTKIFSKVVVASQVNQALTDRFGTFGANSQFQIITINKIHKSQFTYNALLNQSIQYVTGVVNVNGVDQQYIVGMTYHGNTNQFEAPTLQLFMSANSSDNWQPATVLFSQ